MNNPVFQGGTALLISNISLLFASERLCYGNAMVSAELPYRYITWRLIKFQKEHLKLALRVFPGDLDRAIIFVLIARLGCADWVRGDTIMPPERPATFSINAIATSLSRAFETVRRHVHGMIDEGVCARTDAGVVLAPTPEREADIIAYYREAADLLLTLARELADHGIAMPRVEQARGDRLGPLLRASLDVGLVAIENNAHTHWYELILHGTIIYENGRDIMGTPETARIYGNLVLTAEQRRPVTIRALADEFSMPYATVRRHISAMLLDGRILRKRPGYILNPAWTGEASRIEMSNRTVDYLFGKFRALAAAGCLSYDRDQVARDTVTV